MKKMGVLCLSLAVILSGTVFANNVMRDTLKGNIGVAAQSMGNAVTGLITGPSATLYNPAGLANPGFSYDYEQYDYNQLVYTSAYSNAISLFPFGIAFQKNVNLAQDSADLTAFGFGRRTANGIDWGFNVKNINATVVGISQQGWSSDLGILVRFTDNIQLGLVGQDIFRTWLTVNPMVETSTKALVVVSPPETSGSEPSIHPATRS
jgi:hypothetical protein